MAKKFNEQDFQNEVLNKEGVALVDFYADWCGPCKMLGPVIDNIAEERTDIVIGKVNVDDHGSLAAQYNVMSIPTLIVFKDGKEVNRMVGLQSKAKILDALN